MKKVGPFLLSSDSVRRFYDLHSWAGILGGLALFVCVYSGTLALFERELVDQTARLRGAPAVDDAIDRRDVDDRLLQVQNRLVELYLCLGHRCRAGDEQQENAQPKRRGDHWVKAHGSPGRK